MGRLITPTVKAKNDEWHRKNRERLVEVRREFYRLNPEAAKLKGRKSALKAKYGMTVEDYDALLKLQKGRCAMCKQKYGRTLHVDHDHRTNVVRGLLCQRCNMGIGLLQDSINLLQSAIDYLKGKA